MTNVSGRLRQVTTAPPPGSSASLTLHTRWAVARATWLPKALGRGARYQPSGLSFATVVAAGRSSLGPGADLWDRIIVTPRTKDVGFVLSDQAWPVQVWNTFKRPSLQLTTIAITGPGGVTVQGPTTMVFYPNQAQSYNLVLAAAGDATVANLVTWSFAGVAGADLTITGSRITVFPHRPDWSEPPREGLSWLTEVLPGYDRTEQRRSLRQRPRHTLTYRVQTTDPLETATLEALLYGWQARKFGAPVWPEAALLLAAISPGATSLLSDTTDRPNLEAGGMVMVWSDFATWEAFKVASVAAGLITLGSQVTKPWAAGARVVPLRLARFGGEQALGRPANWLTSGTFVFTCEGA